MKKKSLLYFHGKSKYNADSGRRGVDHINMSEHLLDFWRTGLYSAIIVFDMNYFNEPPLYSQLPENTNVTSRIPTLYY